MVGRGFEHFFRCCRYHDYGHQLVWLMAMVTMKMSLSFPKTFSVWYFLGEFLYLVLQELIRVRQDYFRLHWRMLWTKKQNNIWFEVFIRKPQTKVWKWWQNCYNISCYLCRILLEGLATLSVIWWLVDYNLLRPVGDLVKTTTSYEIIVFIFKNSNWLHLPCSLS